LNRTKQHAKPRRRQYRRQSANAGEALTLARRPIRELLIAHAAGESLTASETRRVQRRKRLIDRAGREAVRLRPAWLPLRLERAGDRRSAFDDFVAAAKRGLRRRDAETLRTDLRVLLTLLRWDYEQETDREGAFWKRRRTAKDIALLSVEARQKQARAFVREIEAHKAKAPAHSTLVAVESWLQQTNSEWDLGLTDEQRRKKIRSAARRYDLNKTTPQK
jgi:hypothetical protein